MYSKSLLRTISSSTLPVFTKVNYPPGPSYLTSILVQVASCLDAIAKLFSVLLKLNLTLDIESEVRAFVFNTETKKKNRPWPLQDTKLPRNFLKPICQLAYTRLMNFLIFLEKVLGKYGK